ncbi:GNAT family N-acetyltransferase [Leucothrix sargassi]|nr:GNAT family N-acetyltransferase [Leucothrix sargassi]
MLSLTVDEDITLQLANASFAPRYAELVAECRDYLSPFLHWPRLCHTEDDFLMFIEGTLKKYENGESMVFGIVFRGEVVGNISFNTINHKLKKVDIGYWLAEKYQGHGIITRSCRFLIDYAFTELNLEKVQIGAAVDNTASRAVCERLGLMLEGVITNNEKVGERILDHAIYGIHSANVNS